MEQKQVKIIGLSINENFGSLKAVELKFDEANRLTVIKGEVGSGKSTLQRAMKLTTQGSQTMQDKTLLGDNINIVAQLLDGNTPVFVGCKSKDDGALDYFIYTTDSEGKKIKDVVIDGKKLTPANYLKSLQTALTWSLNELTSENPTVQRDILLNLYQNELQERGVYFDKNHPKYPDSIIDKIEKAKNARNYADMKRKECGGIADDLNKKGIDYKAVWTLRDLSIVDKEIADLSAKITLATTNVASTRENALNVLKLAGTEANTKLRNKNDEIKKENERIQKLHDDYNSKVEAQKNLLKEIEKKLMLLFPWDGQYGDGIDSKCVAIVKSIEAVMPVIQIPVEDLLKELTFNERGSCISKKEDFLDDSIIKLIEDYQTAALNYTTKFQEPIGVVDTKDLEKQLADKKIDKETFEQHNKDASAVNSFQAWKEKDEEVKAIKKDYFHKLTEINTGVDGLFISPEFDLDKDGNKIARDNDIYLMYNGSYDPEYFHNPNGDLRKLAAYSDTQKPMICLLIQRYLLSKKAKMLPYLWIDQVPIDKKTKALLDRMSEELGLWLFANWTGDFEKANLTDGEILIENGEVFYKD